MRHKKLYKNDRKETQRLISIVSSVFKTRTKYVIVLLFTIFHMTKIFRGLSYFAYISTSEDDNTLILFSKDAPSKTLLKKVPIGKQKSEKVF
jgi:hypothetical protein